MFMRKRQRALEDDEEVEESEAKDKPEDGKEEVKIITPDGHINFFSDLQTGVSTLWESCTCIMNVRY